MQNTGKLYWIRHAQSDYNKACTDFGETDEINWGNKYIDCDITELGI